MSDRLSQLIALSKEMPDDTFLKYGIALEYVSRNEDTKALLYFQEIHQNQSKYLANYYQLGKLYERISDFEAATTIYNEGIEVAKNQKDRHTQNELQSALDELQ